MRRKDTARALGPYQKAGRWYVVGIGDRPAGGGSVGTADDPKKRKRQAFYFSTEREAVLFRDKLNGATEATSKMTLPKAIESYLDAGEDRDLRTRTLETARGRLALFFGGSTRTLRSVTQTFCESRYQALRGEVSVATHRHTLAEVKRFFRWCIAEKLLSGNPAEPVQPIGKSKKRKAQLRLSEARTFVSVGEELLAAVQLPDPVEALRQYGVRAPGWVPGDVTRYRTLVQAGVVSALTALYLGMRASEIVSRQVRDLDDEGRLLHIEGELKSESSERVMEVPLRLRTHLLSLAKGKAPTDALFGEATRKTVHYWAKRLAEIAGVPTVTAHGLRGSFASIARSQGAATGIVSAALGHGGEGVTLGHYIEPGAVERGNTRAIAERLDAEPVPD